MKVGDTVLNMKLFKCIFEFINYNILVEFFIFVINYVINIIFKVISLIIIYNYLLEDCHPNVF